MNLLQEVAEALKAARVESLCVSNCYKTLACDAEIRSAAATLTLIQIDAALSALQAELAKPPMWALVDGGNHLISRPHLAKSDAEAERYWAGYHVAPVRVLVGEEK